MQWTKNVPLIMAQSTEIYELGLYREDGVAQWFFTHHPDYKILSMCYLPCIAWAAEVQYRKTKPQVHYYTHPNYRRQGIANKFYQDYLIFTKEQL